MEIEALSPLIAEAEAGAPGAKERLFSALYAELHRLAQHHLRHGAGVSISPTTLLHETYLGMIHGQAKFTDRACFMGYASKVMRGLIIDFIRQRNARKRGGEFEITQFDSQVDEGGWLRPTGKKLCWSAYPKRWTNWRCTMRAWRKSWILSTSADFLLPTLQACAESRCAPSSATGTKRAFFSFKSLTPRISRRSASVQALPASWDCLILTLGCIG